MMTVSENILYELLNTVEWPPVHHQTTVDADLSSSKHAQGLVQAAFSCTRRLLTQLLLLSPRSTPQLVDVINSYSIWKVCECSAGGLLAVLHDSLLEIRHAKQHHILIAASQQVRPDAFPRWRLLCWSRDGSLLAIAYSDGVVQLYTSHGDLLYTIYPPRYREGALPLSPSDALAAITITDDYLPSPQWLCELVCVEYSGVVRGYLVSATDGFQPSHSQSFLAHYPHAITAATLHRSLLVLAGPCPYLGDPSLHYYGTGHGLTLWRRQYPHWRLVSTLPEDCPPPPRPSLLRRLLPAPAPAGAPCCVRVSPCGRWLAALHFSGAVSLWRFPGLRRARYWPLRDQPDAGRRPLGTSVPRSALPAGQPVALEWWCRHEQQGEGGEGREDGLVLLRGTGALTISSCATFANLLGDNPEFLSLPAMVGEPQDGAFLCLEREQRLTRRRRRLPSSVSVSSSHEQELVKEQDGVGEQLKWEAKVDGEEAGDWPPSEAVEQQPEEDQPIEEEQQQLGYVAWLLTLFWSLMYWITDDQRFQASAPLMLEERHRLVLFRSSSPHQLFANKIMNQEYGEALLLARTYELDSDLVYQEQWRRSVPSLESISDYLSRIRARHWVLQQCCDLLPPSLLPARELLLYGLRGTDLHVMASISSGDDVGEWLSGPSLYDCEDEEQRQALQRQQRALKQQVDWTRLTSEQRSIVEVRRRLLRYLDRLDTYEYLLGGGAHALERFDPSFYGVFRAQSSVAACQQFARTADVDALSVMWSYQGSETLSHRLATLHNIPPTIGPFEYRSLLPACSADGEVLQWPQAALREQDWCEDSTLVGSVPCSDPSQQLDDLCSLYAAAPGVAELCGGLGGGVGDETQEPLTPALLGRWYALRARQLERDTGLVDAALDLLKLGRELNVPGLEPLLGQLTTLEVLVYEAGQTKLTLQHLQRMQHAEVLQLLMGKAVGAGLVQRVRAWLLPYLSRCEAAEAGARDTLLTELLRDQARVGLAAPLAVLQFAGDSGEVLSGAALHRCALACVYACEDSEQLDAAHELLDVLPHTDDCDVQGELRALRLQLWGCAVLRRRGVPVLPAQLRSIERQAAEHLYTRMARAALRSPPPLRRESWEALLHDMLELQQKLLDCTSPSQCYRSVAEALLSSGMKEFVAYGGELLLGAAPSVPSPYLARLSPHETVLLIVEAARGYFNSAEHHADEVLQLARQCLELVSGQEATLQEEVQQEKDLIEALDVLHEFGVERLPLQVRLCSARERLVQAAIECRPSHSLKYWWRVVQLAALLRVRGDDGVAREAAVLGMLAEQAIKMGELDSGYSLCDRLMFLGRPEGWQVCAQLAQQRPQQRPRAQAKLLDYALAHCTAEELPGLLVLRNNVELSLVCEAANTQMGAEVVAPPEVAAPPEVVHATVHTEVEAAHHIHGEQVSSRDVVDPTSDGEEPFEDAKDTTWLPAAAAGGSLLTGVAVVATTRALWTSAARWLTQRRQQRLEHTEDAPLDNSGCRLQGCHAFYADNCPEAHCSVLGCSYSSYAPGGGCGALQAPLLLLRAAMLQRTLQGEDGGDDAICQVVQAAARAALPEDTALGLAFLLLLPQPRLAKDVLDALPHTDIAIQVSQYYYALQIYSLLHPWPHPSPAPVLQHDPATVIACAAHVTRLYHEHLQSKGDDDGSLTLQRDGVTILTGQPKTDGKLTDYYDYFRRSEELLDDYLQGQALLRIDAHIDIERFLRDSSYKEDTVLGLCMTTDTSVLALAVTLADKYGVPLWQVHMTHLQHLFGVDLTTQELTEVITERGIMATLKTRPDEFVTCMETNVLALIDGCDHTRLLLYYSLVQECEGRDGAAARHVGVLRELRGAAPGLSYHHLLAPRPDTLQHLGAVLTPTNLSAVVALLTRVPGAAVTRSTAHCAYCIARFLALSTDGQGQRSVRDWRDRYTSLHAEVAELSSEDLLQLLRAITLSEDAFRLVPLQARVAVLDAAVKDAVHRTEEYAVVAETLLQWKVHLAGLQSPAFEALSRSPDLALRRCARLYGLSGGGATAASALCEQALLEGGDLALIRELLTALPEDSTPLPEDLLHGLLQRGMDALVDPQHHALMPAGARDSPPQQRQWWVSRLQHLTAVLGCELREGNDLLTEELLTETARDAALHPRPPLQDKLALLRALQENVPPSEEDQHVLLLLETCSLLQGAALPVQGDWREEVEQEEDMLTNATLSDTRNALLSGTVLLTLASLQSDQERETLFHQLLDVATDATHTRALLDLLLLWPPFSAEVYESLSGNPWELLLTKLVQQNGATPHDQQLILSSVQHALKHRQLPASGVSHVCHALLGAGRHAWCIAGRVALLVDCPHALIAVVAAYTGAGSEVCSGDYEDALLEGLLRGLHLPRLLHTPLYAPCCEYLIRTGDSELLHRVLQQLQQHAPDEAAALQRRATAARPTSASLSTAFRTVYRKLL